MPVTLAPIRPILTIDDICELLRISKTQFWTLHSKGWFQKHHLLVAIQPEIDSTHRYSGEPFAQWLSDKNQARWMRSMLREIEASGVK